VVNGISGEPVADALPVAPPDPPVARRGSWGLFPAISTPPGSCWTW
jgi:hypothetical protein